CGIPVASGHGTRTGVGGQEQEGPRRIGASVVFLLLVLPTLGSHGTHQRFYDGEPFICSPALGPATSYPASMFEEREYEPSAPDDVGIGATRMAKTARYET